ncbi:restriction endonuclease subunit S [Pumilibacter muris]|uniref:restriction endonuclease subunit S n=1 Tax=Pumilibacter muris TaxID=2941510 RepID=UPI00203CA85B|nr:restriction endonuclease subunit S [Pumilibacter muris]
MRREKLRTLVREYSERNRHNDCSGVYSVTNSHGFMPSTDYFSKEVFSKDLSTYKVVKRGMIAYNPSRINVGSVAVQRERETVIVSPLYVVFSVDESKILPEFLTYFLHSDEGLQQIAANTSGSVRDSLKFSALQNIEINLYSIEEQQEIIAILNKFDKLLHDEREALQKINDLVKSQFIEMFGTIPKDRYAPLDRVCKIITDGTHQPPQFSNSGIPFLFVSNLANNEINYQTQKFISKDTYKELIKRTPIQIGDVLLSTVGSYGHPAVVTDDREFCFQRHIAYFKPNPQMIDSRFLYGALLSPIGQEQIERAVKGIAQKTLNLSEIRKIRIPLPSYEHQKQYSAFYEQTDKSKFRIKQSLEKLETCYNAMLQKYFG